MAVGSPASTSLNKSLSVLDDVTVGSSNALAGQMTGSASGQARVA